MLEEILCKFDAANIEQYRMQIHDIEHAADKIHHDILNKLSTEFITPIDQEDILRLAQIIDDITDALDEVVMEFYMYHIDSVPAKAAELSKIVNSCVSALHEAAGELKNFKKPAALRALVIKVNDIETEADSVYMEAIYDLFGATADSKMLLGVKAVYESLESCCDLCEHATDIIEQVIIKNT
jgi:uncharacterized protein Yka (UPF0111/DUF47 family)